MLLIPRDWSGENHADGMKLKLEVRDHAEIAAAAAQRPQEVGIHLLGGGNECAIRQNNIRLDQVVDGQAVLARQVAMPAAQGEAGNSGGGDDACGWRKPEGMGGVVEVTLRTAGADARCPTLRIDPNALHD